MKPASTDGIAPSATTLPMTPFLTDPRYSSEATAPRFETEGAYVETPFITSYQLSGVEVENREAAEIAALMDELHDVEFEAALENLVSRLRATAFRWSDGEVSFGGGDVEARLANYLAPLEAEVDAMFAAMEASVSTIDGPNLSEEELGRHLDGFDYQSRLDDPVFDDFLGKLIKKVKKVAKKGLKVVKKVAKTASRFLPTSIILKRLRKLARPLLKRVLKFALNKIPAKYRPLARRLARRAASTLLREDAYDPELTGDRLQEAEQIAADLYLASLPVGMLATEFDEMTAAYLVEGEGFENSAAALSYETGEAAGIDPISVRARLSDQLASLGDGEDAQPVIEDFIAAILPALRLGIKIIGRKRVVNFIAGLVARLIQRFVGKQAATPLSRALVDAGLKLINLESPEERQVAAAEVLTATIANTMERFLEAIPQEAIGDEPAMAYYLQHAFNAAAAQHFPGRFLRAGLRAPSASALWALSPAGRRFKAYKKLSRRLPFRLSRAAARTIGSFGGETLEQYFTEQMNLLSEDDDVIEGEMTVFEMMSGGQATDIVVHELESMGLGSAIHLHPLTEQAAAALTPDYAGFGRATREAHLLSRQRLGMGQRLYVLHIPGVQPLAAHGGMMPAAYPMSPTGVKLTLDHRNRALKLRIFLCESTAQRIRLRMAEDPAELPRMVIAAARPGIRKALSGAGGNLRIVTDDDPQAVVARLRHHRPVLADAVARRAELAMVRAAREGMAERFDAATADEGDGVTLSLEFPQPGGLLQSLESSAGAADLDLGALGSEKVAAASGDWRDG